MSVGQAIAQQPGRAEGVADLAKLRPFIARRGEPFGQQAAFPASAMPVAIGPQGVDLFGRGALFFYRGSCGMSLLLLLVV